MNKVLSRDNLVEPDARSTLFTSRGGVDVVQQDLFRLNLAETVPAGVRTLFEAAQAVLLYARFYYPLYTTGLSELLRAADAATYWKCVEHGMAEEKASQKSFADRIKWLESRGTELREMWETTRELRNSLTHAPGQYLMPPGMVVGVAEKLTGMINGLFMRPSGAARSP